MPKTIKIQAGKKAIQHIRKNGGLAPQDISVIPAAAGGPKWIILHALDKYLMQNWFGDRVKPLHLVGASAGAWRMLCHTLPKPVEALDRFLKAYVEQSYPTWPTPHEVSQKLNHILAQILGADGYGQLLRESTRKLYVISSLTELMGTKEIQRKLKFSGIVLKNTFSRKSIRNNMTRVVFTNSSDHDILVEDHFATQYITFSPSNIQSALRSTGTIPFLMEPVSDIASLDGLLWDGALVDYHIGLDYNTDGLILYPHFADLIIEGWFDKFLPWRKFSGKVLDRMIMISPTSEFISRLPDAKIPDRKDFETYMENDSDRISNWYQAAAMGNEMAEEWDKIYSDGSLLDHIIPFN